MNKDIPPPYSDMEKDWDALDLSRPFTVVGILSEVLTLDALSGRYETINTAIHMVLTYPEDYRW